MSRCAHFGGRFGHKMCSLNNTIDGRGAGASDGNVLRMVMFCTRLNACVLFDTKRSAGITRRHTRFGCFSGAAARVIKGRACLSMHVTRCAAAVHRLEVVPTQQCADVSPIASSYAHRGENSGSRFAGFAGRHPICCERPVLGGRSLLAGSSADRALARPMCWQPRPLFPAALRRGSRAPG